MENELHEVKEEEMREWNMKYAKKKVERGNEAIEGERQEWNMKEAKK